MFLLPAARYIPVMQFWTLATPAGDRRPPPWLLGVFNRVHGAFAHDIFYNEIWYRHYRTIYTVLKPYIVYQVFVGKVTVNSIEDTVY